VKPLRDRVLIQPLEEKEVKLFNKAE
jgi:co-chaperonin GroES (HSP10)